MHVQADTESEEFGWADELLDGQIDDGFRGFEALPNDDGSAAVGTDGEESFNVALPAERQSPHSPPAVSLGRCMAGRTGALNALYGSSAASPEARRGSHVHTWTCPSFGN